MLDRMTAAIAAVHLSDDDLRMVAAGANPHDLMDFNVCLYGAFCAVYFREPDAASEEDTDLLNAAYAGALEIIKERFA